MSLSLRGNKRSNWISPFGFCDSFLIISENISNLLNKTFSRGKKQYNKPNNVSPMSTKDVPRKQKKKKKN